MSDTGNPKVAPRCNHHERFTSWEDHSRPIYCAMCEIESLTQRLAAAEAEITYKIDTIQKLNAHSEQQDEEMDDVREKLAAAEAALNDAESDHQMFVAIAGSHMQMVAVNINAKALDCGLTPTDKWDADSIMRVQDAVFDDMCWKNDGWALEVDQLNAKIVRLETLLREAGDFMAPHAYTDWKKKLETAKGTK